MKKLLFSLIAIIAVALVMGCGSSPSKSVSSTGSAANAAKSSFPAWFAELPPEDAIYGIGIATLQNQALGLETATTRAQRDAARQVSAVAQGMLIDYANESGLASNPRSMISIENIGRNLTNMNITGSTVNARDYIDGTWYVRISVMKADVVRQAQAIVDTEMADYAEYRRERALEMLDSTITSTNFSTQGMAN